MLKFNEAYVVMNMLYSDNLNTSYVKVQSSCCLPKFFISSYLNTSYVKVQFRSSNASRTI